jgi:hypothetical protein
VRLAETRASWADADRISIVHLLRALDLHLKLRPEDAARWGEMQEWLRTGYPWILSGTSEEHTISFDPKLRLVEERWPMCSDNHILVKCAEPEDRGKARKYHLVYPLSLLTKLVNDCMDSFREDPGVDPYPRFSLGTYLIQQLN